MSFFVPGFDTQHKRAAMQWAREDFDSYDSWGWVMSWLFDIAGELWNRDVYIPELQYDPGPLGPDISEDRREGLALLGTESLEWAARVLNRYDNRLRAAGLDY